MAREAKTPSGTAKRNDDAAAGGSRVPAVDRAWAILTYLRDSGPATLTEVVTETGINKSTCLYTLRTLLDHEVVAVDSQHRYGIGPALIEFAHVAAAQNEPLTVARRYLADLLDQMDVTFVLYRRPDPRSVTLIDKIERPRRVRITVAVGSRLPIHVGATGRCFLAYDQPELLDEILADGLRPFTEKSTTDVAAFRAELAQVRDRGWAVDRDGYALGVSAVTAPIFDRHGRIELVAGAVGFSSVMTEEICTEYGGILRTACDLISRTTGGRIPQRTFGAPA